MRKIEFGYSNDADPKGSWEGIGIKQGLLLTDAEYYGAFEFDGNNYIVAKVVEDKYNRFPQLVNKFIVRRAIYDIYADGSGTLFLDQEENVVTQKLEQILNSEQVKSGINEFDDIFKQLNNLHRAPKSFKLLETDLQDNSILATSIKPEAFELKNQAINSCRKTFSEMQIELSKTYTK